MIEVRIKCCGTSKERTMNSSGVENKDHKKVITDLDFSEEESAV